MVNSVLDLIKSIGETERRISDLEFVSPVFHTDTVIMRIHGLVYKFNIPPTKLGWHVFKPSDTKTASIIRDADLSESENYLNKLQKIRAVLIQKNRDYFLGIPLKNTGMDFNTPIPVLLTTDWAGEFDTITCGYDGLNLWYSGMDMQADPARVEYLREQISKGTQPQKIRYKGLTLEEKTAYMLRFTLDKKLRESLKEILLKKDVEFAGGKFVKFQEKSDHFSVTYEVDGHEYTSYVSKDPVHHVLTAGICLNGGDKDFDLTSLITVLREGQKRNLIHRYHNTDE